MPTKPSLISAKRRNGIALALSALAALLAWRFATAPSEYYRIQSPDGRHHAVATVSAWRNLLPGMPGQGGDKPGNITVYRGEADSQSCGRIAVENVSAIYQLDWQPNRAEIRLVASWDLLRCQLEN